jgi:transposase
MAFAHSGGECHESLYVEALLAADPVRRGGRGRPRVRPGQVVGDKGYSYRAVRDALARRGIRAVIPRRRDQRPEDRRNRPFDRTAYRERNRVERLINRLKQYRRVATRYEKRAAHCLAMLTLAAVLLWL